MPYSQIIAFIMVMVIFELSPVEKPSSSWETSATASLLAMAAAWLLSRVMVLRFLNRFSRGTLGGDPARMGRGLVAKLHGLAVLCLGLVFTLFEAKAHLMQIPALAAFELLAGLSAASLYLGVLILVWEAVHPLEKVIFRLKQGPLAYVGAQVRFLAPVVFPWLLISGLRDAVRLASPEAMEWMGSGWGDFIFLALFLILLALFFPPLVKSWWGCTPWPQGPVRDLAVLVLQRAGVKIGGILSWPIMGGEVLSAGILGLAPRLRYLLITPALAESLNAEEMAGVVAHEAGHVHHRHIAKYLGFFLGFFAAAWALAEMMGLVWNLGLYLASLSSSGVRWLGQPMETSAWLGFLAAIPFLIFMFVYLRFIMGFFMRHFERQADFYASRLLGGPDPLINALEKVAAFSGGTRNVPSWHHFSVAQRVKALQETSRDSAKAGDHRGLLARSLLIYLALLAALVLAGTGVAGSGWNQILARGAVLRVLEQKVAVNPHDALALMHLGIFELEEGNEPKGLERLRGAHALAPGHPEVLNSLAWFLVKAKDRSLRNASRALALAKRAVTINPAPHIWDTLAEAYYANGRNRLAVAAARSALRAGTGGKDRSGGKYLDRQLRRFEKALRASRDQPGGV